MRLLRIQLGVQNGIFKNYCNLQLKDIDHSCSVVVSQYQATDYVLDEQQSVVSNELPSHYDVNPDELVSLFAGDVLSPGSFEAIQSDSFALADSTQALDLTCYSA